MKKVSALFKCLFSVSVSFTVSPHSVNSSCVLARQLWPSSNHVQQPRPSQTTEKRETFCSVSNRRPLKPPAKKRCDDGRPHVDSSGSSWKTLWLVGVVK